MAISRLVEAGIYTKMIRNSLAKLKLPSYWTVPMGHENEPLFLIHVTLSFLLCLGGLVLATITFIFEIVHYKRRMHTAQSKSVGGWVVMEMNKIVKK